MRRVGGKEEMGWGRSTQHVGLGELQGSALVWRNVEKGPRKQTGTENEVRGAGRHLPLSQRIRSERGVGLGRLGSRRVLPGPGALCRLLSLRLGMCESLLGADTGFSQPASRAGFQLLPWSLVALLVSSARGVHCPTPSLLPPPREHLWFLGHRGCL